MNKLKCYRVENLDLKEYELVKVTTCQITYLNHNGVQITENKVKSGASNTKLFEFIKDALEWLDEKHYRNVINSKKISNKAYMQAMRMHAEFLKGF